MIVHPSVHIIILVNFDNNAYTLLENSELNEIVKHPITMPNIRHWISISSAILELMTL
jgi:hypothetical protein